MADCDWNRHILNKTQMCWAKPCACYQLLMAKNICINQWHIDWKCERTRFIASWYDILKPLKHYLL